ncbi:MAG: nicotinamide riboside transporter PnuC [Woeseiaceae bacterium]|nr:nicotinamide riboside transporter PnuC [Woeseiaceae bacterium]MDX2606761.1 nicotinamide riboside transporter PnuC [Woeseiaceae bacterium]
MQSLVTILQQQAATLSLLEVVAVVMALLYLFLAIRQNIWCWFGAGISTAIYVYLFLDAKLYMQSALNGFYFAMAIYGWVVWRSGQTEEKQLPVVSWPLMTHVYAILLIAAVGLFNGYVLDTLTDSQHAYADAIVAWGAIWATFLVARKVLENWWYWLVIDIASIFIYWSRDLQLTSVLFAVYVLMIPFGLVSWARSRREAAS